MTQETHVVWHPTTVNRPRGCVIWLTGLSGSGKSTIANSLDAWLHQHQQHSLVLDGDNIRHGLNASPERLAPIYGEAFANRFGLSFAEADRQENIRRIASVAEILCGNGMIVLTAFVSPFRRDRQLARDLITTGGNTSDFVEVFVDTPLQLCESRDPKGLYRKARSGELKGMTGIDSPYEPPLQPEIHLRGDLTVEQSTFNVIEYLRQIQKIS